MHPDGMREDWSLKLTPENLIDRANELIKSSREVYDSIAAVPDGNVSYESVLKVLSDMYSSYYSTQFFLEFPRYSSTNSNLRDASAKAEKMICNLKTELNMRQDVFEKLQILESKNPSLTPEAERYLKKLIKMGKRNGLHLPEEVQKEIKSLKNRIDDLVVTFSSNLNEVNTKFEFSAKELDGMSSDFLQNLKKNPDTEKYIVTLKYPDYIPIMQKCRVPETRRQLELAFNSQCAEENGSILEEMLQLRHKAANLLGYPNHAAYVTEILMSKCPENVENFLTELKKKLAPLWIEEKKLLLDLKAKECHDLGIPFDGKLNAYDSGYYTNKVKEEKYAVDETKLKEYFPMHIVIDRVLSIYQKLLGLTFTEVTCEVWHEDVRMFSVKDASTSESLGYFFLDLFPREGKYSHAAMFELQPGCLLPDGSRQKAIAAVLTNFSQSKTSKPSLMDHDEVTTFFHEFGHVMHYLCAKANFAQFSSGSVEWDFIEAPSQMLENWCWEPEPLKFISSHYADQSEMPEDLLNNLIKSKLANTGYKNLRQVILALFDFKCHSSAKSDVKKLYAELSEEILGISPSEGTNFASNFRHITKEYDSQYYGYLWSEVFSVDMFETCFKKGNNVMNPEVGMNYRKKILQPGGSKDASDMLVEFLGRPPTQDAFLKSKGLIA